MFSLKTMSIVLTTLGTAINIWASVRMIYEIKPTNFGFLVSEETVEQDMRDTVRKKWTVGLTIIGTTLLLIASILSNFA